MQVAKEQLDQKAENAVANGRSEMLSNTSEKNLANNEKNVELGSVKPNGVKQEVTAEEVKNRKEESSLSTEKSSNTTTTTTTIKAPITTSLSSLNKVSSLLSPKHFHASITEKEEMAYATQNNDGTAVTISDELIRQSYQIIKEAFDRFAPETMGISFNGGKDSVVMVELLLAAVGEGVVNRCCLFVLDEENEFLELVAFRNAYIAERLPNTTLHHFSANDNMREGLWLVKQQFGINAAFVGTRRSDPSGKYQKTPFEPTTSGWPPMMRICPLLYWEYCDIWSYIRANHVPFCKLYLEGYSSIGRQSSTFKQRHLQRDDNTFNPPWLLPDNELERSHRCEEGNQLAKSTVT